MDRIRERAIGNSLFDGNQNIINLTDVENLSCPVVIMSSE